MVGRTTILDELKERTLEEVLREVASQQEALTVHLPEGQKPTRIKRQDLSSLIPKIKSFPKLPMFMSLAAPTKRVSVRCTFK